VMLDRDLASLYQVETKQLNLSVKRNIKRFPADFMFQLTKDECKILRFQNATSSWGGTRYLPNVFTEQGVAMLSGLLNSDIAIEVNIKIMRAFVLIRQYALTYADLKRELDNFMQATDIRFNDVYQALTELVSQKRLPALPRRRIGYFTEERHSLPSYTILYVFPSLCKNFLCQILNTHSHRLHL